MSTSNAMFSIVIPAYNYGSTLGRAVESAITQNGGNYEILVVDDGSTDNTDEVLRELHRKYPGEFLSVRRENSGLAATRNFGILHTKYEWLIFLDSDDELEPAALEVFEECIMQHPGARMLVGGHMTIQDTGNASYKGIDSKLCNSMSAEELFTGYLLHKTVSPSNGATAMHRSIFDNILYPESFRNSEDIPVFAYVFATHGCAFVDKAVNRIYKHSDSLRHNTIHANKVGLKLVDEVFSKRIPPKLHKYKKRFAAQRCLSLFRTFYLAGDKMRALYYYRMAINTYWLTLFNLSYLKKALRCMVWR